MSSRCTHFREETFIIATVTKNVSSLRIGFSFGEPMAQARALALLSERLRPHGLTIVCYTGYTLKALKAQRECWVEKLLSQVDVLIDGPYVREKAANLLWRGSSNQRVHFLTDRYRHFAAAVDRSPAEVEFVISSEGFTTLGTWPEGFLQRLREVLRR